MLSYGYHILILSGFRRRKQLFQNVELTLLGV
jgi:hypothetical protein